MSNNSILTEAFLQFVKSFKDARLDPMRDFELSLSKDAISILEKEHDMRHASDGPFVIKLQGITIKKLEK
ncbi:MAG: hypothetical protein LBT45_03305 [Rickettsiales bacterium]|jgi:hypothetical protein|nr:hypothetical protein [Rickettsiales bacterium]